jgi:acylphosphatase
MPSSTHLLHKNIRLSGRVQGVGFRYSAQNAAEALGIKGYVRNLPNGEVFIEAEGTSTQLQDFVEWCHEGPVRATIRNIDMVDSDVVGYKEFLIR